MNEELKPCCRNCKYLGRKFDYLSGHQNITEWRRCDFPKPWHLISRACPMTENAGERCPCFNLNTRPQDELDEEEIMKLIEYHSERITGYKIVQKPMKDLAKALCTAYREGRIMKERSR